MKDMVICSILFSPDLTILNFIKNYKYENADKQSKKNS